jgi:hypothetical protein
MRRLTIYIHILVFALVVGIPSAVLGLPPAPADDDWKWIWESGEKKWLPQFEITARPGNHSIHGMELDPFIPIGQDADSLFFVNVRNALFWSHGDFSNEINAGAGYRQLMGDRSWILGGYVFYDFMDSENDNHFSQGTLGIEALAWDWEARANGYIAGDDTEWAPGARHCSPAILPGPIPLLGGCLEQAMSGFDAEVGWRLPFFGEEGALSDTRLYAGGFWFDGSAVGDLGGPMTRFETRIWDIPLLPAESRLTLGTEYRWDHRRNSQVTGLLAVRVPLGGATRSQPLTNVERRMTDRVVRDVSVVVQTSNKGNAERVQTLAQRGTPDVVGEKFFFDGEIFPDGIDGDGSFEDPGDLPDMIAAGGPNALLIGLDKTGDVNLAPYLPPLLALQDGQTVMGGGTDLPLWGVDSGQMAVFHAPGSRATLNNGPGLTLAHNNTISGLDFVNTPGHALNLVLVDDSTTADIFGNRFYNIGSDAVFVDLSAPTDHSELALHLNDNEFIDISEHGLYVGAVDSFDIAIEAHGNIFVDSHAGLEHILNADGSGPSSFSLNASGNTFVEMDWSIYTEAFVSGVGGTGTYTHTANIWDNDFIDGVESAESADYYLEIVGDTVDPPGEVDVDVAVRGNRSVWGENFVEMYVDPIPDGHIGIEVVDNQVLDVDEQAIYIDIEDAPDVHATIARNEISWGKGIETDGPAIEVLIADSGDEDGHVVTINDNIITSSWYDAINVDIDNGLATDLTIANNEITNTWDDEGIYVDFDGVGDADGGNTIAIEGNIIGNSYYTPIYVDVHNGSDDTALTIADNIISFIEYDDEEAIWVGFNDVGHDADGNTITIQRNTVEFGNGDGIGVDVDQSDDTAVTIADNIVNGFDGDGIWVDLRDSGHDVGNALAIDRNTITSVTGDGVYVNAADNFDTTLAMAGNAIGEEFGFGVSTIGGDGISINFDENDLGPGPVGNRITINGQNTIRYVDDAGIAIDVNGASSEDTVVIVGNNTVEHVGDDGIEIDFFDVVDGVLTLQNNVLDGSDSDGISIDLNDGSDGNTVTITLNQISNSGNGNDDGIEIEIRDSDSNVFTLQSNQIANSTDDGIDFDLSNSDSNLVTLLTNVITNSDEDGIDFNLFNGSDLNTVEIRSNTVSLSDEDGMDINVPDGNDTNTFRIGANNVDLSVDGDGIDIFSGDATTVISSEFEGPPLNNIVTNSTDLDAEITGTGTGTILVNGTEVGFP